MDFCHATLGSGKRREDSHMRREFSLPAELPAIVMRKAIRHAVERAWTAGFEALYLAQCWGPKGHVNLIVEIDAVQGGHWRIS
jgi:hypothetical protein